MQRRRFLQTATTGALAGAGAAAAPWVHAQEPRLRWRMATSWPESLEPLFGGAAHFCQRVGELTDGRFRIRPYAGGELVGGLQVLDAVRSGTVETGHTASYYYTGTAQSLAFDTAVPFGMTARMQNAWLYGGGGRELLNERVFRPLGIVAFPGGNTGAQMGGWFREEVPDLAALQGLRMRIPGLGGEIMQRLGVSVQVLGGPDIYPALERGAIDATEWVGPYDDLTFGFHQIAPYYYMPGWWEPGPNITLMIQQSAWDELPPAYQELVETVCLAMSADMTARYDVANPQALATLVQEHGVTLRAFSDEILEAAWTESNAYLEEQAAADETVRTVYESWKEFRDRSFPYFAGNEVRYARFAFDKIQSELLVGQ